MFHFTISESPMADFLFLESLRFLVNVFFEGIAVVFWSLLLMGSFCSERDQVLRNCLKQ
jgi:hypothetical protein